MTGTAGPTGIFDAQGPPSRALVDQCVHCGFCLPTCPTYVLWGEEMDSPRGRIHLMEAGLDGRVEMNERFVSHFDSCLGCLACVTACPSGVDYAALIDSTRAQIERRHVRSRRARLLRAAIFRLAPHPARLRAVLLATGPLRRLAERLGLVQLLPASLRALAALAPTAAPRSASSELPGLTAARGERRARVGMLIGCVQRVAFGDVNAATVEVLSAEGCDVVIPRQECCGALELHAGLDRQARARARRLIAAFEAAGIDHVVVNVAGCGSAMKSYGRLLADDEAWASRAAAFAASVRDVSELLCELGEPRAARHPLPVTVAYHDACHLGHGQGVRRQPRELLAGIPELVLVDLPEGDLCCGSAGIFNIVNPEPARRLAARKVAHIATVAPDVVATGNAGCLLQLRNAQEGPAARPVVHPIELLHASLAARPVEEMVGRAGGSGRAGR